MSAVRKCELVKRKEGDIEFAVIRGRGDPDLVARVLANDRSDIRLIWLKRWRFPWRGYSRCNIFVVKKLSVGNHYAVEHWRLYEPPEGKPYVLRRFKVEIDCAVDHEEELGTPPIFIWERVKDCGVRDLLRELRAAIDFDMSVLFERLSRVAPFGEVQ